MSDRGILPRLANSSHVIVQPGPPQRSPDGAGAPGTGQRPGH